MGARSNDGNDTIGRNLGRYQLGDKIRRLRLRKKLSLAELGRHTSLSAALLSKLERGHITPTLPTLLRIALVFGVGLDHFFAVGGPRAAVVRRAERLRFPERPDSDASAYWFESLDFAADDRAMNAFYAEFAAAGAPAVHTHECAEFLHVLSGSLTIRTDTDRLTLDAGDSIYIHPGVTHVYEPGGAEPCRVVVVTAPVSSAAQTRA